MMSVTVRIGHVKYQHVKRRVHRHSDMSDDRLGTITDLSLIRYGALHWEPVKREKGDSQGF